MKYKLAKGTLEEYEEGRVLAVITAKTSRGEIISAEDIANELFADKDVVAEVVKGLVLKGKVEEVS